MAQDLSLNNYIYQNLFEINESLRRDKSQKNINACKQRNVTMGNMIKARALEIHEKNYHLKVKPLPYTPEMFGFMSDHKQLENHPEPPLQSKDFIAAQIDQYKRTLPGDDLERMPGPDELTNAGYGKLVELIDNGGGFVKWAEILGLKYQE